MNEEICKVCQTPLKEWGWRQHPCVPTQKWFDSDEYQELMRQHFSRPEVVFSKNMRTI